LLTRDLFAVSNLLVELSSGKHAPQNHQHCHQYNTHSSSVTKLVIGRGSSPDPAGEHMTFPSLRIRPGLETPFRILYPSMPSVSRSKHLTFQPLHWSVPIVPILRNDHWACLIPFPTGVRVLPQQIGWRRSNGGCVTAYG